MADIFEYLEFQAEEDNEPLRKAAAIAVNRAETIFPFLEKASNRAEFDSRLALVQDKIDSIVDDACEEFGCNEREHVSNIVLGQIELIAADTETGDSYYTRRDDLPSADQHGELSGDPSPKLDPDKAGDQWHTFQDEPEIESVRHRNDRQNVQNRADYAADLGEESGVGHPLVDRVDADTPMQPEFWAAPHTDVFPNKGQAQPVTSRVANETLRWFADPGHAWLRVPLESARGLGISEFSHQDQQYAYLEEDSDAGKWLKAHNMLENGAYRSIPTENEPFGESFVRGLEPYNGATYAGDHYTDRDAFLNAHGDKSPRQLLEEERAEMRGDSYHSSSNTEAEFRKCVEDYVNNGMPAEAALNHDDFMGLPETVKTNIINELRGKQTFSKKNTEAAYGDIPTDPITQEIVNLMIERGLKTLPEIRDNLSISIGPVELREKMREAEHVLRLQGQTERAFAQDFGGFAAKKKLPKSTK